MSRLYMDAAITPNRSLSKRGFALLFAGVCLANLAFAAFLVVLGAWPAPAFLGLDVLAVWLAMRASFRAAERIERVTVSAHKVEVWREDKRGQRCVWTSPTAFTRVALDHPSAHDARVRLMLSHRRLAVGRALNADDRTSFAEALRRAIAEARAERYPG